MSFDDQLKRIRAQVEADPNTGRILTARWQLRLDPEARRQLPPVLYKELARRNALSIEILDGELERRWLRVAPPVSIGNDGALVGFVEATSALAEMAIDCG